jgi:SAM-dependent methyltransferase
MAVRKRLYRAYARIKRRVLGTPEPGRVNFGDLRRVTPISRNFGSDRGPPVDRYYIERFLREHAADIRGHVMEIGSNDYTLRFGGQKVTRSDVLNVHGNDPRTTIVADIASAPQVADATFDCIIFTQTLQYVADTGAAVETLRRILKPGGILLLTVPGVTLVPSSTAEGRSWLWAFTPVSVKRLLDKAFGQAQVKVGVSGNVLVACAFLQGLSVADLLEDELEVSDPDYPVIVTARAVNSGRDWPKQ